MAAGLLTLAVLPAATTPKTKKLPPKKIAVHRTRRTRSRRAQSTPAKRAAWHPAQTTPTPDRYKEIQEALAKKGYLHSEPNGVWSQDSVDALRHFQQDQNLQASGKLDSLSLIALGLGPKY